MQINPICARLCAIATCSLSYLVRMVGGRVEQAGPPHVLFPREISRCIAGDQKLTRDRSSLVGEAVVESPVIS